MELSARKMAVLEAIVKTYIETGEPVGSKILTSLLENAPSSATLRNEMSELCELGLLAQPHTSAGRVPTSNGFRLYVTSLMRPAALEESTKRYIKTLMSNSSADRENLPLLAADCLNELTGFPAVACCIVGADVKVRKVELLRVSSRSGILFLITSDGRARSRFCRIPPSFNSLSARFEDIINKRIRNTPLNVMNKAYLQNIIAAAGLDAFDLMPLITAVFEMAEELAASSVKIRKAASLYNICGEDNARRIISLSERGDAFLRVFEGYDAERKVIFGSETGHSELYGTSVAVAKYHSGGRFCGYIGIIGPNRMSYEQIIPSIEYTAELLSELMSEAVKDMED